MTGDVRHCTFSARLDCHYLLSTPPLLDEGALLVVAMHGFAQTPEMMLPHTRRLFGGGAVIASLAGPNQFFTNRENFDVGFGWNTNRHAASSIRLHHDMVLHVLNEVGSEYGIPPERRFLAGFSQPVPLNYRLAATIPSAVRGVVGICGGMPGDWETGDYQPVTAAVLHIARREDEFYPPKVTEQYPERLRLRVKDQEFHLIDGGHRIPSHGRSIVAPWLERVLGR
jgi:predicted esterase